MGLLSHAVAFGLGYALATPGGRKQAQKLQAQATDLMHRPEVKQLQERAKTTAGKKVQAAKSRLGNHGESSNGTAGAFGASAAADDLEATGPGPVPAPTPSTAHEPTGTGGFTGTTVAEDSEAVRLGLSTPPATPDRDEKPS